VRIAGLKEGRKCRVVFLPVRACSLLIILHYYCIIGYETHQDHKQGKSQENGGRRRMRRVPDFLPVSVQDVLHRRKPEMRKKKMTLTGKILFARKILHTVYDPFI
jgi:hypothetical protein